MNRIKGLRFLAQLVVVMSAGLLGACANDYGSDRSLSNGQSAAQAGVTSAEVSQAQALLVDLGFEPGPVDGLEGPRTASAVSAYQGAAGLTKDGRVSAGLVDHLTAAVQRRQVVSAQGQLASLGYDPGPIDGRAGPRTHGAVEEFQGAQGLTRDGRITSDLLAALESAGAKGEAAATAEAEVPAEAPAETATEETATEETATEEVVAAAAAATAAGAAASQAATTGETETTAAA